MRITVDEEDVSRWLRKIEETERLLLDLQRNGTELVEENRSLRSVETYLKSENMTLKDLLRLAEEKLNAHQHLPPRG